MRRILITGANRGLGLEFTRQYLERGGRVFAAVRDPGRARELAELQAKHPNRLTILPLDVADAGSIRASHAAVSAQTDGLDLLLNNAGIYSTRGRDDASQQLGRLDFEDALAVLRVNTVAPLLVAQEYLDLLRAGTDPKIASLSSGLGSVSANRSGFPYYYSASKAALNQVMRSLAADAAPWGIITVLLDPGWVQTDMGGPNARLQPRQSIEGLIRVIDGLTPEQNGRFLTWQGNEQAW
jgi:NAD(P)-dependent dehydrogenase (short-subunit alcohol dehydrogenase family)